MSNANLLLIGGGEFSLITGATAAPASETDYDAGAALFGNVESVSIQNQAETKEHFGTYRGVRILDRVHITQLRLGYTLQLEEVDDRIVETLRSGPREEGERVRG